MKKGKQPSDKKRKQTGNSIKKHLPVKNKMTDSVRNTASETEGLNQAKTTRDDLFPSDGDNLTN